MSTPVPSGPDPDLAEAEAVERDVAALDPWARVLLVEYDRRGRVEAAARALLARCDFADREHAASADLGRPAIRTDEIRRLLAAEVARLEAVEARLLRVEAKARALVAGFPHRAKTLLSLDYPEVVNLVEALVGALAAEVEGETR